MWELLEVNLLESLPSDLSLQNPEPSVVRHREFCGGGSHNTVVEIPLDPFGEYPPSCFLLYLAVRAPEPWQVSLRYYLAAYFDMRSPYISETNVDSAAEFFIADCKALVAEPYSRNDH